MSKKFLDKANKLDERRAKLKKIKSDLRPQFCSGVAFKRYSGDKNDETKYYRYHFFATVTGCEKDESILERVAIEAMYNKVCDLLDKAEKDFEDLFKERTKQ